MSVSTSKVRFTYGVSGGTLYCFVKRSATDWSPNSATPYWDDCVFLSHSLPRDAEVVKHSSGLSEVTQRPEFFSPEQVTVRGASSSLTFGHGGNIFFKRSGDELWNRLWAYNEISDSFWWSVSGLFDEEM